MGGERDRPVGALSLNVAYCLLASQDKVHEFGLASRAGLVEHVSEVCPCCRQRDAEAAGSGSQPIAFQYLACEPGFRPSQPEVLCPERIGVARYEDGESFSDLFAGRPRDDGARRGGFSIIKT
jgi:hypothetical protein